MKNQKLRKALLLVVSAMLLMSLTVVGTLAYLTANTETVENSFTVGKVVLADEELKNGLDELDVDEYGEEYTTTPTPERVLKNEYKLVPGHTYIKDPTVHVAEGSEPCYVFVKVENGIADIEAADAAADDTNTEVDETKITIAAQMKALGWKALAGETNVYYYAKTNANGDRVDARTAQVDLVVFETFTLADDADVTADENEDGVADWTLAEITIDAFAVQADGFDTAAAAWAGAKTDWK